MTSIQSGADCWSGISPGYVTPPYHPKQRRSDPHLTFQATTREYRGRTSRLFAAPRITFRHIEEGRIRGSFLAANGGPGATGLERIDRVLQAEGESAAKQIDSCVRTVLRRLGGLPEARGNRSVYVDCPFARAWWRERLVNEVSHGDPERAERVREVTRVNQTYWEELVVLIVSQNSVLGSRAIRDTFILSLADLLQRDPNTPLRLSTRLRAASRMVGVIQASRELSVLHEDELRALMNDMVRLHHEHWSGGRFDV